MQVSIATTTIKASITALQADSKASKCWVVASDAFHADGVTASMLTGKDADNEVKDFIKANIIVPSFTAKDQALLAKEGKSLSDEQKTTKRYLQQQVGSKLGKIASHLAKLEAKLEAEAMSDEEKKEEAAKQASIKARLDKDLASWIVRLEKCEANDFKSLPDVIKALKIAQTVCNAA